ncbi:hypothetical protein AQ443_10075 [Listeria monocytogenes]|nr:hypothetical protein [Listeria monocytogenes]ECB9821357.1 hypothetical protein [Listeria monocytogenes]
MYEAEAVIHQIKELKSISTFHRWRKLAEDLCNVSFKCRIKQVGATSYTKVYQFSDFDIEKFRQVAILRNRGHPIREAILFVFKDEQKTTSLEEQHKQLFDKLIETAQTLEEDGLQLTQAIKSMQGQWRLMVQRVNQLEQRIEAVEMGKMDKPFKRKHS